MKTKNMACIDEKFEQLMLNQPQSVERNDSLTSDDILGPMSPFSDSNGPDSDRCSYHGDISGLDEASLVDVDGTIEDDLKLSRSDSQRLRHLLATRRINNGGTSPRSPRAPRTQFPTRSQSYKRPKSRPANLDLQINLEQEEMRPRTSSMPSRNTYKKPDMNYLRVGNADSPGSPRMGDLYRVRSFRTTKRGQLINHGDSFKRKWRSSASIASEASSGCSSPGFRDRTESINSRGSTITSCESHGEPEITPVYQALILGGSRVGKSALAQQFMTSEYMGDYDTLSADDVADVQKTVSVLIDGDETMMDVIDLNTDEEYASYSDVDAYVVVYSITDRKSYQHAIDLLHEIRMEAGLETAIILVGNKSDIVRQRQIAIEEGKSTAQTYDCKFIETSAVLNHQIDDLLAGIVKQIRLKRKKDGRKKRGGCHKVAKGLIDKLLLKSTHVSKSCDNLFVL
ncbi:unnamed protein product [Owenia fusiformis]|nr:unnamed protein product [Owenia fusiformis]